MASTEESPLKLGPASKKQKLSVNTNICIICQQNAKNQKLSVATDTGIESLVYAANTRKDNVCEHLIEYLGNLDELQPPYNVRILYHRGCVASYTSKRNLSFLHAESDKDGTIPSSLSKLDRHSRRTQFDWSCCIICAHKTYKRDCKLHRIETFEKDTQLKKAAETLRDHDLLMRIQDEDLIAKDALYHHYCMNTYLYKATSQKNTTVVQQPSQHDVAFKQLLAEIEDDLIRNHKVFLLSYLLRRFKTFLPTEVAESYTSQKLQNRLVGYYANAISVLSQKGYGQSNFILSSEITINDALISIKELKQAAKDSEIELSFCSSVVDEGEQMHTLHAAAGILRTEMQEIVIPQDYPTPAQVSQNESANLMPPLLSTFMEWLVDKHAYNSAEPTMENQLGQHTHRKCLAITEMIVSCSNNVVTPLQLGLAIQLHHEYGSRNIIETLSSYGFSASYDELRRFLTSAAEQEANRIDNGTYIPSGIVSPTDGGAFVHEGDDNVDINTETIDGKNTFHSMARAVFQQSGGKLASNVSRIKRVRAKSLKITAETESVMQIEHFNKPTVKPEPPRYEHALQKLKACQTREGPLTDLSWVLLRMLPREASLPVPDEFNYSKKQLIPFWTGFNHILSEPKSTYTNVSYAPIINAKPSDMETVYTTMKRCRSMTSQLGQQYAIQTMDQQLYVVAQQVKWSAPQEFSAHFIRLGGFHALSCYISAIGKIWGDGGLRDLLADSGVYAPSTVDQMLAGKQFNRAVRGLTLAYEACMDLWVTAFFKWCAANNYQQDIPMLFWEKLTATQTAFKDEHTSIGEMFNDLQTLVKDYLGKLMTSFVDEQCKISPTFQFWNVFLNAMQVLLLNIRAERTGDWNLSLTSQCQMLPYIFVSDKMNYSRWLPVYLLDMLHLPEDLQSVFKSGQFSIRQTPGKFNGIWSDMGTEKTVIKDCKGQGGIGGMTQQKSALVRWSLTRHILGEYTACMRKRAGITKDGHDKMHEESQPATQKRDEEHVQALTKHMRENMTDPFDIENHPDMLLNISTGLQASTEVQDSLLTLTERGQLQAEHFVEKTLDDTNNQSLYTPIKKSGLKTFTSMTQKTKLRSGGVMINVNISPELVFRRALTLSSTREEVTAKTLLSHPIGAVPTSLFHDDGTMRRCTKADLGHKLEDNVAKCTIMPEYDATATVIIRDVMAIIQALPVHQYHTFDDLASNFVNILFSHFETSNTVVDVYDQYNNDLSIKAAERKRRTAGLGQQKYQVIGGRAIPPWKKFLAVNANKISLQKYLNSYVLKNAIKRLEGTSYKLYIVGGFSDGKEVKSISGTGVVSVEELYSPQEEADTRIFLHACSANEVFKDKQIEGRIVIKSPDTDVLVLAVHFFPQMDHVKELWIQTGSVTATTDHRRYISVHGICKVLSPVICNILPAVHALTGCDTTSSFFGIGKRTVFKAIQDNPEEYADLQSLSGPDAKAALVASRRLILKLYSPRKMQTEDLDALRLKLASQKNASLAKLPPCEKSFLQHVKRASWQTKVWTNSNIPNPDLGSPLDHGWKQDGQCLIPVYFDGPMASELLQHLICNCASRDHCGRDCSCKNESLSCTELCPCSGADCKNPHSNSTDQLMEDAMQTTEDLEDNDA